MLSPDEVGANEEGYVIDADLVVEDPRPPIEIPPKNYMAHT